LHQWIINKKHPVVTQLDVLILKVVFQTV